MDRVPLALALVAVTLVVLPGVYQGFWVSASCPGRVLLVPLTVSILPSFLATAYPRITVEKAALFLLGISVYVAVSSKKRDPQNVLLWSLILLAFTGSLVLIGPVVTEYAAKDRYFAFNWLMRFPLKSSEILDPNLLAGLIVTMLPLSLAVALWETRVRGSRRRICAVWVLFGFFCLALILTESRASYVAASGGIVVLAVLLRRRLWWVFGASGVLGAILLWLFQVPVSQLLSSGRVANWSSRNAIWDRAVHMIQDFPFTGIGAGTFSKVLPVLYPLTWGSPGQEVFHSHNLYLQVAVDSGIPHLVAFIGFVTAALAIGWRGYTGFRQQEDDLGLILSVGYLSGVLAYLLHGVIDAPLWLTKPHPAVFFLLGILAVFRQTDLHFQQGRSQRGYRVFFIVFALWILISMTAISLIGEHFGLGFGVALAGGIYLGYQTSGYFFSI